jgi:hypothetical protein
MSVMPLTIKKDLIVLLEMVSYNLMEPHNNVNAAALQACNIIIFTFKITVYKG